MDIIYVDESGDDGVAPGASPLFALAFVHVNSAEWRRVHGGLWCLRRDLQAVHGLPASVEWHTRPMLLRKHPYREVGLASAAVRDLCLGVSEIVLGCGVRVDMWVVVKQENGPRPLASTLLPALAATNGAVRLAFSDEGRIGTMRRMVRDAVAQGVIDAGLIESIVGMASAESALVQLADVFATAAYLRVSAELALPIHARIRKEEAKWVSDMASGPNQTLHLVRA